MVKAVKPTAFVGTAEKATSMTIKRPRDEALHKVTGYVGRRGGALDRGRSKVSSYMIDASYTSVALHSEE